MASYRLSVKSISRSAGRSAVAGAAYRSGERLTDARTGDVHDYRRKIWIVHRQLVTPEGAPAWATRREVLWNAAEAAETRKNARVAREVEIALPAELGPTQPRGLTLALAAHLACEHGVVDVAVHAPGQEGDQRNHHAHLLLTTRRLGPKGFTEKTRELDDQTTGPLLVAGYWPRVAKPLAAEARQRHAVDIGC